VSDQDSRAGAIISALDMSLAKTLELERAKDADEFLKTPGNVVRFVREPKLRMARHFDLEPTFLVLEPTLGSLGIIEIALPSKSEELKAAAIVQRHVDTATYARHLLLRDRQPIGTKALSVELVLLTAIETEEERRFFNEIGSALRLTQSESDSLHHIGVGILCYAGADKPFGLRRAFPWLLKATRRWFGSDDAKPQAEARPAPAAAGATQAPAPPSPPSASESTPARVPLGRLGKVTLSNYRLPGTRDLELADAARVHLVHGANGSGKSSIVEALELVATGKVDRLEQAQEKNYEGVIKNDDAGKDVAATITLAWKSAAGEPHTERRAIADWIAEPIAKGVEASSFRLDQPLMDKLIGRHPHERARDFLRAFFPEAKDSLADYTKAAETWQATLPAVQRLVETLDLARTALVQHSSWRQSATSTGSPTRAYPDLLNRWLERTVLLDLLQKARVIQSTVEGAEKADWSSDEFQVTTWWNALAPARDFQAIEQHESDVKTELDALQRELSEYKAPTTSAATSGGTNRVTALQAQALNDVCRWLFKEDDLTHFGLFGEKLARVLNGGDAPTYGPTIIGSEKWAAPLIEKIDALINACQRVAKEVEIKEEEKKWPPSVASSEYQAALEAHEAVIAAGRELSERFKGRLQPRNKDDEFDGSLVDAINELLALFTPARWSYRDIELPVTSGNGKVGVDFNVRAGEQQARADLHFNTAELNLFTVALFILCATRLRKPLNLLLFDDPLQNMDELTSTALARGLAKVVRLWASLGRTEELLLLFHGEDDLARFSKEIGAASYRLPWLSPSALSPTKPVVAEPEVGNIAVQSITHLLEERSTA
jgi:hypothetical protein